MLIAIIREIYSHFGFEMQVSLSTRPEKSMGREPGISDDERAVWDEIWKRAEDTLKAVLDGEQIAHVTYPGDGAFYGPKIDFHVKDALARWHQLGTIQLDFSMPKRFGLKYTNSDSAEEQPVMIHRAIFGSLERFMGILIEHTGGDFPFWLVPVQARVIAVSDELIPYAEQVRGQLLARGLRVKVDYRNEKLGFKIRDAELGKVPVVLVVGKKEQESQTVSLRWRKRGDLGQMSLDQSITLMLEAAAVPSPSETLVRRVQEVHRL